MRYGEPTAELRRIPVYLVDTVGEPVTGASPTGSQVSVSESGASWVDGAGSWAEVGAGLYRYEATQAEVTTPSFLLVRVAVPGTRTYVYSADIGGRISSSAGPTERRVPIYLADATGAPVPGLTLSGVELQVSLAGTPLVTAAGTASAIGDGAYYYELSASELVEGPGTLRVADSSARPYVYTWDVAATSPPAIAAVSPTPGVTPGQPGGFSSGRRAAVATPVRFAVSGAAYVCAAVVRTFQDGTLDGHVEEVVFRGGAFREPFGEASTRSTASGQTTLSALRDGGWTGRFLSLVVTAVGSDGSLATEEFIYELPDPSVEVRVGEVVAGEVDHVAEALDRLPWQFREASR